MMMKDVIDSIIKFHEQHCLYIQKQKIFIVCIDIIFRFDYSIPLDSLATSFIFYDVLIG